MNEYQKQLSVCINEKLIDYAMSEAHSLYNIELMYKYYIKEYSTIYKEPKEYLTKIMVLAYQKTIKEYEQ